MSNYDKPMVLANEELAEGVYTASGGPTVPTEPSEGSGDKWDINNDSISVSGDIVYATLLEGDAPTCEVKMHFYASVLEAWSDNIPGWTVRVDGNDVYAEGNNTTLRVKVIMQDQTTSAEKQWSHQMKLTKW